MTEQEKQWFEQLAGQRRRFRESTLENNFDEIWDVITSPYSDQAHFVYELLQNADDCEATEVSFDLYRDRLVFVHNGKRHFSVSNPDRSVAQEDARNGRLGHVNAITGVSNSTKRGNSIGKFGIGFKSVFLYTATPRIYDDGISFEISDFIVPGPPTEEGPRRETGTTVFVFPFNQTGKDASANPAEDIYQKLKSLVFPTFFLRHLTKVAWRYQSYSGEYKKDSNELVLPNWGADREPISVCRVNLTKKVCTSIAGSEEVTNFLQFSRKLPDSELTYSVAFRLNESDEIIPVNCSPFCYFPTKVDAQLNFVVNAPFLLTSNRADISEATAEHRSTNQRQIDLLGDLLADSIVALRDLSESGTVRYLTDDIIVQRVIPLKEPIVTGWEHLNLRSMYEKPLQVFKIERVIPCLGGYCSSNHAYVASRDRTISYFADEDLRVFVNDKDAHWVFRDKHMYEGKIRQSTKDTTVLPYIAAIVGDYEGVTPEKILAAVSGRLIESKLDDFEWLQKFYKWLCGQNRDDCRNSGSYAILLDQNGRAACANDTRYSLYLPIDGNTTFRTVHERLYQLPEVKELVEDIYHLRKPAKEDLIEEYVRRAAETQTDSERDEIVKLLMKWACTDATTQERVQIVENLKKPKIGRFRSQSAVASYLPAKDLWFRTQTMEGLFAEEDACKYFIDEAHYSGISDGITSLLEEVGIGTGPRLRGCAVIAENNPDYFIWRYLKDEGVSGYRNVAAGWRHIAGVGRLLKKLHTLATDGGDLPEGVMLYPLRIWNALAILIQGAGDANALEKAFEGSYLYRDWHGKTDKQSTFVSPIVKQLRTWKWILTSNGEIKAPSVLSWESLPTEFTKNPYARQLCQFLEIKIVDESVIQDAINKLPEQEQRALALGKIFQEAGVGSEDDVKKALDWLKSNGGGVVDIETPQDSPIDPLEGLRAKTRETKEKTRKYKERKERERRDTTPSVSPVPALPPAEDEDDVMQPKTIDFDKKIEDLRQKMEKDIAELEKDRKLQDEAVTAADYTYAWLRSRLDMEIRAAGADDETQHEATVTFGKIEKEVGSRDTFVLSLPSGEIPQWFEEEVNQPLELHIPGRNDIRTVIKSMNVKQFTLEARIEILPGMEGLDYSTVTSAKTSATKPAFLLNSLRAGYASLGLVDDYDLKANLPKDIRFIFGPPGTGKTTHLARKELIPLAEGTEHPHVLVLTPTNKAADVLVKRIISEKGEDKTYERWLYRFGHAADPELQTSAVAIEKNVSLRDGESAVVVTTIQRFAYDVFQPTERVKIPVSSVHWDYVIVDEASMIPLMQILFPLYQAKAVNPNVKFVVAGDPMQIEPVIISDISKGDNIYTMVRLDNFACPTTEPHPYEVVCLDTQYRSIPCVGEVFSKFAYSGLLKHARKDDVVESLRLDGVPEIRPLTLLRFPVDRNESIYRVQKLSNKSAYHIYAALFVFEYVCKVIEGLKVAGRTGFRIGVISPYRAQAEIIGRLVDSAEAAKGISVQVGTVHGFQGDECDMIIAMLNPPRGMGKCQSFINNVKVLNVAVSRARDYLVVVMPREKTYNIEFLTGPVKIASLMREHSGEFVEYQMPDIERTIWGDASYIDHNTYPTGHQSVNVYEVPEKRFEVRASEDALDVQFHEERFSEKSIDAAADGVGRIDAVCEAEDKERSAFVIPPGFHAPSPGEDITPEQKYYIMGQTDYKIKNVGDEIEMSQVLAIED